MNTGSPYPSFWQAIVLLAAFLTLQLVLVTVTMLSGLGLTASTAIGNIGATLFVLLWGVRKSRRPVQEVLPFAAFRADLLVPLVLAVVGLHILLSELDNVTRWIFPMPDFLKGVYAHLLEGSIGTTVLLVIVAPMTEEPFCRGLILGGLARRYSPTRAVLWSALFFAVLHLNPYQFASAFLLGSVFGWLFLKTGSLWPCIIGHAAANGTGWIACNISGLEIPGYTSSLEGPVQFQPWWFDGLGMLIFAIGCIWLTSLLNGYQRVGGTAGVIDPTSEGQRVPSGGQTRTSQEAEPRPDVPE